MKLEVTVIGACDYFQGDSAATQSIDRDDPLGYQRSCQQIPDDNECGVDPLFSV